MDTVTSNDSLKQQNRRFANTGGISQRNRGQGFLPAFRDEQSGAVYLSRTRDGNVAPVHMIEGLPDHLVMSRDRCGRAIRLVASVIAGFVRGDRFYTRQEAADAVSQAA
ncbi:MAG: hypothetical protein H6981_13755 [Gammaproteobacteria bacterium]|nr:hypothetical protein [Gammaproteobacteria bacterium]